MPRSYQHISNYEKEILEMKAQQSVLSSHTYLTNSDPTLNEWYEIWINTFCRNVIKDYTVNGYEQRFKTNIYMHVTDSMQENVANTMGNLLGGNMANS